MTDYSILSTLSYGKLHLKRITQNYDNESLWILNKVLDIKKRKYFTRNKQLTPKQYNAYLSLIKRRLNQEPLQHILGDVPFYGRFFLVNKNVFISRQETEICIDIVKRELPYLSNVLEVGCGIGSISITLKLENLANKIMSIDINPKAIRLAKKNNNLFNCRNINYLKKDIFNYDINDKFDLLISNPPYISLDSIENLDYEVRGFDPIEALTDYGDGLTFFKYFALKGREIVHKNGFMLFEFGGQQQLPFITSIFTKNNYNFSIFKDYNNNPRFILIRV